MSLQQRYFFYRNHLSEYQRAHQRVKNIRPSNKFLHTSSHAEYRNTFPFFKIWIKFLTFSLCNQMLVYYPGICWIHCIQSWHLTRVSSKKLKMLWLKLTILFIPKIKKQACQNFPIISSPNLKTWVNSQQDSIRLEK